MKRRYSPVVDNLEILMLWFLVALFSKLASWNYSRVRTCTAGDFRGESIRAFLARATSFVSASPLNAIASPWDLDRAMSVTDNIVKVLEAHVSAEVAAFLLSMAPRLLGS